MTTDTNIMRQIAILLEVDIPEGAPDGECDLISHLPLAGYGAGPGERDPEDAERSAQFAGIAHDEAMWPATRSEAGSALQLISAELSPRIDEMGRESPAGDARSGRDLVLERMVLSWPHLPVHASWPRVLAHTIERMYPGSDGKLVIIRLLLGRDADTIRRAIKNECVSVANWGPSHI